MTQEYKVEKIIGHQLSPTVKRNKLNEFLELVFVVKWLDYSDDDNTMEPWKNVRDNTQFKDYIACEFLSFPNHVKKYLFYYYDLNTCDINDYNSQLKFFYLVNNKY